jgi:transcriptional regulator with XRE-family HTH domain
MVGGTKPVTEAERWRRFGRYVRTYREDNAGLSQTEAAKLAEMTRQQWNRIEKGTSGSKRPSIIKIAEALNGEPRLFLAQAGFLEPSEPGEPEPIGQSAPTSDLELKRLTHYFSELPRECQLDVMALTEALWRRRRAEGRAERTSRKGAGKHRPETVRPGIENPGKKRKAG